MGMPPLPFPKASAETGGIALMLGAGFSKWAVGLPVASELFDFAMEPWGPRDQVKLDRVQALKQAWDLANPEGPAEQFIAYALQLCERQRQAVLWYIGRRLSEPFIWYDNYPSRPRRHVLMIDENRKLAVPGVERGRNFLKGLCGPLTSGIVTTNYDMVVEYALGTKVFNYGTIGQQLSGRGPYPVSTWRHPVVLVGPIRLAKIHGSLSWDRDGYYTDGRRALTGRALIVAPTPEKVPPSELAHVWELASRILQQAARLLVFGFAFNPYDDAVLQLLRSARSSLRSVLLVDVQPKVDQAKGLWPNADITTAQPPPEGLDAIFAWRSARLRA